MDPKHVLPDAKTNPFDVGTRSYLSILSYSWGYSRRYLFLGWFLKRLTSLFSMFDVDQGMNFRQELGSNWVHRTFNLIQFKFNRPSVFWGLARQYCYNTDNDICASQEFRDQ
jgi:hypothetical protein